MDYSMEIKEILNEFAKVFEAKISKEYYIKIQLEFTDLKVNNIWQIDVNNGNVYIYNENKIKTEQELALTTEILKKLYNNELSPGTAFAEETGKKAPPIEFINVNEYYKERVKHDDEIQFFHRFNKFYEFFSKDNINKIIIDDKYSRELHGARFIELYSKMDNKSFFHAFFSIKKDDVFYNSPHNCNIFIIKGNGILKLDNVEYKIKKYEHYHIEGKRVLKI
jgi:hypothetical protein